MCCPTAGGGPVIGEEEVRGNISIYKDGSMAKDMEKDMDLRDKGNRNKNPISYSQ